MRIATLLRLAPVLPVVLCIAACGLDTDGQSGPGDLPDGSGTIDVHVAPHDASLADGASEAGLGDDATDDAGDETPIPPTDAHVDAPRDAPVDAITDGPIDAPKDAPHDSCVPVAEVCNDGVDNDCNGAIDCADTACNPTFACVAPAPAGWTFVELADATRPACDPNFGAPTNVVEGPAAPPAVCSCACAVDPTKQGSCVHGSTHVNYTGSSAICPGPGFDFNSNDGACNGFGALTFTSVVGARSQITPIPYTPGTCSVTVNKSVPPVTFAAEGRTCALATPLGAGCTNSSVCAPKPSGEFAACIQKGGDLACPSAFPTKHLVGTGVNDSRDCGGCACAVTGTCANATFTDYDDPQCNPSGKSLANPADGVCNANTETTPTKYVAWRYSADLQNVACTATTSAATGTATLTGPKTICCP